MVAMTQENCQLKVAMLGASCVGKTCISKRFLENTFHGSTYAPTPGIEFGSRRIVLTKPVPTSVTMILFDIGGAAINSKMLEVYLDSNIDIFVLVYDMTNMASLNELRNWIEVLRTHKLIKPDVTSLALVGAKGDLEHLRTVRLDAHTKFTQEFGISLSFIVSAKSGDSVQTCFTNCASYHLNPDTKKPFIRTHTLNQGELPNKLSAVMTPKNTHAVVKASGSNSGAALGPNAVTSALNAFASGAKVKRSQSSQQLLPQGAVPVTAGPSTSAAVAAGGAGAPGDSSAVCVVQ